VLDTDTKRRIDTCRDILVGKVPDPKSQVEQITIALIYKFMDDMDAEAEELGGKRTFFAGVYGKYGWPRLMALDMGGFDVLALYSEAIQKMNENPGIPALFRDIFKNAYLPYRDPETLRSFLKEIDGFTYDHSERLGDAFEYLLSVLGSQGDAGQFRTPRHIIDFMVEIIDPRKDESILDPACGTAGFLISAWKHILRNNTKTRSGDLLTPDERKRLAANIRGYDISPDMVRLSLVNMYLHGFTDPHIVEYDTLTSDEKWNEYADVILANPPFMSPKGGIKPHKRFSVQATRSEVLFVDYMAEHLTPNGRAAIIVPEGIIFQSGGAYKQLREMLVKTSLVAVVSLPAGVFQPYSGVKTSILVLDKRMARQLDSVLFVKAENDGFGLGAQRRAVTGSDLPEAAAAIKAWMQIPPGPPFPKGGEKESPPLTKGDVGGFAFADRKNVLPVSRERIGENGEWNLSGERYRSNNRTATTYEMVYLGDLDIFQIESGGTPKSTEDNFWSGGINWATLVDLPQNDFITQISKTERTISEVGLANSSAKVLPVGTVIVSSRATIGRVGIARVPVATNQGFKNIILRDQTQAIPEFVAYMMKHLAPTMETMATGGTFKEISKSTIASLQIPLPPLEVQKEIVAEIEGYQKIIDGARQVVENYQPRIAIDPDWPMVALSEVLQGKPKNGYSGKPVDYATDLKVLSLSATTSGTLDISKVKFLDEQIPVDSPCRCKRGDIYLQRGNTKELVGTAALFNVDDTNYVYPDLMIRVRANEAKIQAPYLLHVLQSGPVRDYLTRNAVGAAGSMPKINQSIVERIPIPLPDLDTQRAIVARIEEEQRLVNANKELIRLFEQKIKTAINRVWGEEEKSCGATYEQEPADLPLAAEADAAYGGAP
jgi:type I restriction enzyme M protein